MPAAFPGWRRDQEPTRRLPSSTLGTETWISCWPGKGKPGPRLIPPSPAAPGAGPRAGSPSGPVLASLEETRRHGRLFPCHGGDGPLAPVQRGGITGEAGEPPAPVLPGQAASGYLWHELCRGTQIPLPALAGSRGGGEASALSCFRGDSPPPNENKPPHRSRGDAVGGSGHRAAPRLLHLTIPVSRSPTAGKSAARAVRGRA